MGRYEHSDEGYWEDEGEFLEDERPRFTQRVVAVFTGSYGVSIALHVALLLVLGTIIVSTGPETEEAVIRVGKLERPPEPKIDDMAERDIKDQQEVPLPEVDVPMVDITDVPEPVEIPKGLEINTSNKELQKNSYDDALGIAGAGAGAYGRPDGMGKANFVGGGPDTISVADAGLRWLAAHQSPDGSWDTDGWKQNCSRGPTCSGPGHDNGGAKYDVGITGLALLAFMGQGHTSNHGKFKRVVKKGMRFLQRQQKADGSIGFEPGSHGSMYCHAMATMALCEGYGLRDIRLRSSAQKAVQFCLDAQNPGLAWRYGVRDGQNDTSVTGWVVLALKAARVAKIKVPDESFAGALRWIDRATSSDGATGYQGPDGMSSALGGQAEAFDPLPTMTSVGLVCRLFSGESTRGAKLRKGARLIAEHPPEWSPRKTNFYYWYYGTYALFHFNDAKWGSWNEAMKKALMPTQRRGGCEDGSWDAVGEWCPAGGRVYATAINVLTLEIYYRYKRMEHTK